MRRLFPFLTIAALALAFAGNAAAADDEWARIAEALGKTGTVMAGGVYRVGLPRTDLKVTLDGVDIKPGLALGGWLAFEKMGNETMVMGDLVLTAEEVSPVMTKLLAGGIEVTALHNHLLRNQPFTMYMHVLGRGDPVKLAATLHDALGESKTDCHREIATQSRCGERTQSCVRQVDDGDFVGVGDIDEQLGPGAVDLKAFRMATQAILPLRARRGVDNGDGATVYVANAGDGSVRIFKGDDFSPVGRIKLGDDADNVRIDRTRKQVLVGYGKLWPDTAC